MVTIESVTDNELVTTSVTQHVDSVQAQGTTLLSTLTEYPSVTDATVEDLAQPIDIRNWRSLLSSGLIAVHPRDLPVVNQRGESASDA